MVLVYLTSHSFDNTMNLQICTNFCTRKTCSPVTQQSAQWTHNSGRTQSGFPSSCPTVSPPKKSEQVHSVDHSARLHPVLQKTLGWEDLLILLNWNVFFAAEACTDWTFPFHTCILKSVHIIQQS